MHINLRFYRNPIPKRGSPALIGIGSLVVLIAAGRRSTFALGRRGVIGGGTGLGGLALGRFAVAAGVAIFACFRLSARWQCATIRVIGFVESVTFKDNSRREEDTADMISTFGAHSQRLIGHFLPRLEAVATGLTKILVRWHTPITS
jgi:hypothetical protein